MSCNVQFIWIPSHIGVHLHKVADELAKQATKKVFIDIIGYQSMGSIKNQMTGVRKEWENVNVGENPAHSETLQQFLYAMNNTNVIYGTNEAGCCCNEAPSGIQVPLAGECRDCRSCQLCQTPDGHTSHHYVTDCARIKPLRSVDISNLYVG